MSGSGILGRLISYWWPAIIVVSLAGSAAAQSRLPTQTPDEVRAVLLAWDWQGDWFTDCEHKEWGGHYAAVLGESGFPSATMSYDGTQASEGRLISAQIQEDGTLAAVTESQFESYFITRATAVEVNQNNTLQVLSSEAEFEAIADVPPRLFYLRPEGLTRGTHFSAWGVRDSMVLDSFEKPFRPTRQYHRCGDRLS